MSKIAGKSGSNEVRPVMLLVLGPHRSGTSLTARMLECLGAVNSANLNPPNDYNPKGYFEDWDTYQFNENVLMPALDSSWHSLSPIDWRTLSAARREELQSQAVEVVRRNYGAGKALSVLKEPRISLLLPFWLEVLERAGFAVKAVCPIRDPLSVARSIAARDRLPLATGCMVYFRAWEAVLQELDVAPHVFFDFADIFSSPSSALEKIARVLQLPMPPDFENRISHFANSHLDAALVHNTSTDKDYEELGATLPPEPAKLHRLLSICSKTQRISEARSFCQSAARGLKTSECYLTALNELGARALAQQISLVSAETERVRLSTENSALQTSLASAETERARLSADGAVLRTSLAAAEQTRAQLAAQAAGLQSSLAAAEAERGQLCAEKAALLTSLASAEHELSEARRTVVDLRSSTSWQLTKTLRAVTKTFRVFPTLIRRLPDSLRILFQHRKSGLFDARWYLEKNPGLETFAARPFVHFAFFGVHEGRTPNAYVDEEYYLRHAPSARSKGHRALVHYALKGFWRNAPCCRLFDSDFYRAQSDADLKGCPNLLVHYFRHGWKEGLAPHPWFDTRWYLEQNTDIKEAGLEPLRHYLEHGVAEMRNPHPLFYASWYLSQNPDVAAAGIDPLQHYLSHGRQEGRTPHPGSGLDAAGPSDHAKQHRERIATEAEAIRKSGLFDEDYYRAMYPECSGRCEDPIRDYCENGWREGRNPSDDFNTLGYLEAYQDIKNGDLNPFWHYILWGASEGRSALPGAAGMHEDDVNFGAPLSDIQVIAYFVSTNWLEVKKLSSARKASRTLLGSHEDIGHYDPNDGDFIRRQSRLARQHGISAWCFPMLDTGKRQANNSLEKFLQSPDIEFSFCLELDLNHEPRPELVGLLQRALADKRYMTLRGKRVLIFSPPSITPTASEGRDTWEQRLAASEWPPLYRIARTTGTKRYLPGEERLSNIDALLDFPLYPVPGETGNFTPLAVGADRQVIPYSVVVANAEKRMTLNSASPVPCYPCVTLGRDEAGKDGEARLVYTNFRLGEYRQWLDSAIAWLRKTRCQDDRFLFLNSWNDWNNGAVLEPDRAWGYCRLNETTRALLGRPLQEASPKVSVIVPNFNHARYLHRRLESIYRQTYKNIEVILLDDNSTDQSRDIIRIYAELYPDITRTIFNDANGGSVFRQWAKGISEATGQLVWIAESDDYCDASFLEKLVKCFEDEAVMLAYAKTDFVRADETEHPDTFQSHAGKLGLEGKWLKSYVNTAHREVSEALGILNTIPNASSALFRRPESMDLLHNPQWLELQVVGDWLFYLHVIRGGKIAFSTDTTSYFRRHQDSKVASICSQPQFYHELAYLLRSVRELYKVPSTTTKKFVAHAKNLYNYHTGGSETEFREIFRESVDSLPDTGRSPNIAVSTMGFYPGGAELLPITLANEFKRHGQSVVLLSAGLGEREAKVRRMVRNDIPVVETADIAQTKRILEDFGIEVLNTHQWHLQKYPCAVPDVFSSLKAHIASMHGMIEFGDAFAVTKEQLTIADRHVSRWVYTADKNLAPFTQRGFAPLLSPRFVKLPNGIPQPETTAISRADLAIPDAAFVLCCVSRAIPEKGWPETIEAVDLARESCGRDIRLVLVGNGKVCDALSKDGVPDFVTLTGFHENSHGFYAMADMGIMLTKFRSESFPLTILDCLFAGKPFISCDVGEIANMLTDEEGVAGAVLHLDDWTIPVAEAATIIGKFACESEVYARALSVVPKVAARYEIAEVAGKYLEIFQEAACGNGTSGAGHANGSAEAVPQNIP